MSKKDDIFSVEDTEVITLTSVASKALRDILTCQICKKVVHNSIELPVCSHRFCLPCIASVKKECPICHKRYTRGLKNLKRDIYVDTIVRTLFPDDIKGRPVTEEDMKAREIQYIKESLLHSTSKWSPNMQKDYISKVMDEIKSFGDVYPVRKYLTLCKCPESLVCVKQKITKEGSVNRGKFFYGCPKYGKKVGETCNKFSIVKEGAVVTTQNTKTQVRKKRRTSQRPARRNGNTAQRKRKIVPQNNTRNKKAKASLLDFFGKNKTSQ